MILENEMVFECPYNETGKAFGERSTEPAIKWIKCPWNAEIKET